jgi:hypothetical protein
MFCFRIDAGNPLNLAWKTSYLYMAMRAVCEAQTYRLSAIDVGPGRDGGGFKGES